MVAAQHILALALSKTLPTGPGTKDEMLTRIRNHCYSDRRTRVSLYSADKCFS